MYVFHKSVTVLLLYRGKYWYNFCRNWVNGCHIYDSFFLVSGTTPFNDNSIYETVEYNSFTLKAP